MTAADILDQLHDAHVRAYHLARFAAGMAGFIRSVVDARQQFAIALAAAMRAGQRADAAHIDDVIRNGT